jgi:hypothetical protein
MTEHPTELLLQIADGAVPPPEARAHLASCQRCQQILAALAPLDLGYVWQGVTAELDAPKPSLLERGLVTVGVRPGLARFCATTPSLRLGWLLPMCAAALLAVLVASRWSPQVGASAGMGAWVLVLAAWKASEQPVAWLTGPGAQAAYGVVTATLLVLLIRRMAREGWALADQTEPA